MGLFGIPKGVCVLWLEKKNKIPKGWLVCDGSNGTIDLRSDASKVGATAYIVRV